MQKHLFFLGLAVVCAASLALPSARGQQFPAEPFTTVGTSAQAPDGPFTGGQSYAELVELVRRQTAAITALANRVQQLEARVDALEREGGR